MGRKVLREEEKEFTLVLLSPTELTCMAQAVMFSVMSNRNNVFNTNIQGKEEAVMSCNQAQEVALVTEDKLSKSGPALFYPQLRDMHVWSLLLMKPPRHQFEILLCIRVNSASTKPGVRLLWSQNNLVSFL